MEVPVVLSNAGYTKYLFTHEKNCLIVPAQNPVALARSLATFDRGWSLAYDSYLEVPVSCYVNTKRIRPSIVREVRSLL